MKRKIIYIVLIITFLSLFFILNFSQSVKSVLVIEYGDVNHYAENDIYWGKINGREVVLKNKKSRSKRKISLDFVPNQIAIGSTYVFVLKCGNNYSGNNATIYCFDFEGNYIKEREEKNCNYIAADKDVLFLQYWQNRDQSFPYVVYDGIIANAWIPENKFNGEINYMKENSEGTCQVGDQIFYMNSNGCFSTEQEYSGYPDICSYIWNEMEEETIQKYKYRQFLKKEIKYDSKLIYGSKEYQNGDYIYGVVNVWKEDTRLSNTDIPVNNVVKSYAYRINLRYNEIKILFQLNKKCVQIVTTNDSVVYYEKNKIKKVNMKTGKVDVLFSGEKNDIGQVILQGLYLLIPNEENNFIFYL